MSAAFPSTAGGCGFSLIDSLLPSLALFSLSLLLCGFALSLPAPSTEPSKIVIRHKSDWNVTGGHASVYGHQFIQSDGRPVPGIAEVRASPLRTLLYAAILHRQHWTGIASWMGVTRCHQGRSATRIERTDKSLTKHTPNCATAADYPTTHSIDQITHSLLKFL